MNPFEYLYPEYFDRSGENVYLEVKLPDSIPGSLFLGQVPCRSQSREEFEKWLKIKGIDTVVCLLSDSDIRKRSPEYWELLQYKGKKWKYSQFPIIDLGIPSDREAYLKYAYSIAESLKNGNNILIHCFAGRGRTGCLGNVVLYVLNLSRDEAEEKIRDAGGHPESIEQRDLIQWCIDKIEQKSGKLKGL